MKPAQSDVHDEVDRLRRERDEVLAMRTALDRQPVPRAEAIARIEQSIAQRAATLAGLNIPNVVWKDIDMDERWTASSIVMLHHADALNEELPARFISYVKRYSAEPQREPAVHAAPFSRVPHELAFGASLSLGYDETT